MISIERPSADSLALFVAALPFAIQAAAEDAAHERPGVVLGVAYTGDLLRNVRGGITRGGAYLDSLDVTLALDGKALWNAPALQMFFYGLYNNDATFSGRYVGDAFVLSNIDTARAIRLYEAWAEWTFSGPAAPSVRVGLYDLGSEFDTTESRSLFLNSTYGTGQDLAQTGENGPSIFPNTSLAARLAWAPSERWQLKFAILDGVPGDPADPSRTHIDLSSTDGALLVGEATTAVGALRELSVGHWRYTATFEDLAATDPLGNPRLHDDNQGTYVTAEFDLAEQVAVFMRAGTANGRINPFSRYYALGLVVNGVLPGGRQDAFGLAVSAARSSEGFTTLQAAAGHGVDSHEYNVELTWRIPVNEVLVLQPDLQYVVNPSLDRSLRNAFVVGLRFELAGTWPLWVR